jgi:hypothetical protein
MHAPNADHLRVLTGNQVVSSLAWHAESNSLFAVCEATAVGRMGLCNKDDFRCEGSVTREERWGVHKALCKRDQAGTEPRVGCATDEMGRIGVYSPTAPDDGAQKINRFFIQCGLILTETPILI